MTIKGKIKQVGQTITFDSGFQVRELILTTEDKYPQDVQIKFFKDKCNLLDGLSSGVGIEVAYNLRGNSYKDKNGNERHSTDVVGWRIDKLETSNADQQPDREVDLPF